VWPKTPPPLTERQKAAREEFMMLWHQILPKRYGIIEKFNHGYPARLPLKRGAKTLEIGAGLGEHSRHEDLARQEYHCLEYREEFCEQLRKLLPSAQVHCGDIQLRQHWPSSTFDRIVAIHVLEHLPDLPAALAEIGRLLKDDGVFDVVIPCEGGMAHTLARKISAERVFRKNFGMDFTPIHKNEHVNTFREIHELLRARFDFLKAAYFPLAIPIATINLCAAFRLARRGSV
jgi:SAM-dependent methyltransferase